MLQKPFKDSTLPCQSNSQIHNNVRRFPKKQRFRAKSEPSNLTMNSRDLKFKILCFSPGKLCRNIEFEIMSFRFWKSTDRCATIPRGERETRKNAHFWAKMVFNREDGFAGYFVAKYPLKNKKKSRQNSTLKCKVKNDLFVRRDVSILNAPYLVQLVPSNTREFRKISEHFWKKNGLVVFSGWTGLHALFVLMLVVGCYFPMTKILSPCHLW